ncbi:TonB-dependent receptor [Microbulbifer thermotolerans]|uniref:TonB-dependent receptor n=1 Tax=Microbulbifer thermotolerans TaxID=252514 RepID=UPI0008DF9B3B|nr:TonB-dependent receptor [Microbulbifer thermotolerans]MCX2783897.1 TonB-dependent receptor [Microbulbifer thermotolerans]MCX2833007.1 TonB-dependent receptor [Microbulbifer thermotolerans]SFC22572.1 TonB-dependent receptor [Microbulbifer thermotolerans]
MRNNNKYAKDVLAIERNFKKSILVTAIAAVPYMSAAQAQEAAKELEEVVVEGSRATIQSTIDIKRNSTTIVDGLSATEIGELPALSIGEALESVTGAASHRENGGATEISIRGLGPYLSATTFNGREATNGSGDRSVNFSQFPSELMNKVAIYKTQDASLVEGGVAGVIALETLKPLDYGERRIQFDTKANYNPNQSNIDDPMADDLGFRGTASYVDQFEFDNGMALGVSLGYQKSDISQPESEMRSSSPSGTSLYACINDPSVTNEGFYRSSAGDCEDQVGGSSNQGYNTTVDPETGKAVSDGLDYAFAPSSNGYRQNDTSDERDAIFVALQFQPNDKTDINFDLQQSERVQSEQRHDLNFANMKRVTPGVTGPSLVTTDSGAVLEWAGETAIESNSEVYSRTEEYFGYGLNVAYDFTDNFTVSADYSFSETTRDELQISVRTQSDNEDVAGDSTVAGYRPLVSWDMDSGIRQYVINDFDVTDHSLFSDAYRVRIDNDVDRKNTIEAFRTDFDWRLDGKFITGIQGGLRFSELEYLDLGSDRYEYSISRSSAEGAATIAAINDACAIDFPESDFMDAERDGNLFTVIDSSTGEVMSGTGNSWATFDTMCVTNMILAAEGEEFAYPELENQSAGVTDVTETTTAAYVMATFDSMLANKPVYGNFGVRVVQTEVDSVGYRTPYEVITSDTGALSIQAVEGADLERVSAGGDYTEVLPSFNIVADIQENVLVRGAIYRGLSRPDPSDLGYKRTFSINTSEDITDVNELIDAVEGDGNPDMQPLTSWNFDAAIEWYPNEDTMLAFGVYHKKFQGGFEQARVTESFVVDGQNVEADFTITRTNEDTTDLTGFEVTGTHRFSYLPGYLSGLGVKMSYNYADSDFEFEDSSYGSITILAQDGSVYSQTQGIIEPGNVPGFSEHVFSGQLYYQIGKLDTSLIYKYRSEYFQPYTSNGTRLRYIGDVGVWEARASYRINDNLKLSLEAINLFDEPKEQYFYVDDYLGELNSYGPRIFMGLQARF